jgi:hypothetical protein
MTRLFILAALLFFGSTQTQVLAETPVNPVGLSGELLESVRYGVDPSGILKVLAEFKESDLAVGLNDDAAKKTFWINIYNAMVQYRLKQDTSEYVNRGKFFRNRNIVVAGRNLSLDDIEHRMLRRSKVKWSLGYANRWFPSDFEKTFRVEELDWRIHFALNCGAMSCPAIDYYRQHSINEQLDNATTLFLMFETEYDSTANTFTLPKLFKWFRKDFGGKAGIYSILEKGEYIPEGSKPKLVYKPYDWTLSVSNFR